MEDFDTFTNDFMGQVKLPLSQFENGVEQQLTLDLLTKKFHKKKGLGQIVVTIHWKSVANIEEIVESNKKKAKGIFDNIKSAVVGVPDVSLYSIYAYF